MKRIFIVQCSFQIIQYKINPKIKLILIFDYFASKTDCFSRHIVYYGNISLLIYYGNSIKLLMDNPESVSLLSPNLIYAYDTHRNIPWNDPEYQPPKVYQDPMKQMTQRKYQSGSAGVQNYVTRRGFYMDYHIKVVKGVPSSADHTTRDPWDQSINQKKSNLHKLDLSLSKYNYLDLIATQQKNRHTPAPGSYNLQPTEEQIKKNLTDLKAKTRYIGDKHFFYQDTEHLSQIVPGMGSYNPHDDISHLKLNKTTHKFWIEKHKKEGTKIQKRRSVEPAPGTHTPIPVQVNTFDRIMTTEALKRKKKGKEVFNGFGSDAKFEYTRPAKKKIIEQRPASCAYNVVLEWKGKNMPLRGNNWIKTRSYPRSQSVYH